MRSKKYQDEKRQIRCKARYWVTLSSTDNIRLDMKQSKEFLVVVVLRGERRCCLADNRHQVFKFNECYKGSRISTGT